MKGNVLLTTQTQRDRTQRYGQREASADACAPHRGYPTRAPAAPSQCAALKTKRHNKILEQCLFPEILGKNIIFYEKVIYQ
jgi:hypothetical protein